MSEPKHETEKLREAFASPADEQHTEGCPEPDRIWQAARGQLSASAAGHVVDHVAACSACAGAWRLAMSPSDAEQAEIGSGSTARSWDSWTAAGGLAAAVLLVVAVVAVVQDRRQPPPAMRASEGVSIRSLIAEDTPLPRNECVLRWSAGPEGALYDVRVGTRELRTLVRERELERPEFTVPEESLSELPSGAKILWRVEALLPDGRRISSETFVARIE